MIKKITCFILCGILCIAFSASAFAITDTDITPRLVDNAQLLDNGEASLIDDKLDAIYDTFGFDVVIVTVNTLDGKTPAQYADDFYDYHTFSYADNKDGILLLLNMGERDWFISTTGIGISIFSDSLCQYIADNILPSLSSGYYYDAFISFADQCEYYLEGSENGDYQYGVDPSYDYNYDYDYDYDYDNSHSNSDGLDPMWIPGSIVIGMIISLLIMLGFRSQLKSVRKKAVADDYCVPGSMRVTEQSDMFLYHHVTRTPKQTQNNSRPGGHGGGGVRVGSSGRSHGGVGGKF